jgi:hypothetical protein
MGGGSSICASAQFCDIGKIFIHEASLFTGSPLSSDDWYEIRATQSPGSEMIKDLHFLAPASQSCATTTNAGMVTVIRTDWQASRFLPARIVLSPTASMR